MSTASKVLGALAPYQIKETGRGKYRCRSPYRPESDSPSFALTIQDDEHGTWFDFVEERGGSLYTLAQHLGVDIPQGAVENTKRGYENLDEYALAHGISGDDLRAVGWKEVQYQNRPAIEFVTLTGKRWRFLDGKNPVYKSVQGYKPCWYGLDEALKSKLRDGATLVICNGEISTIAARKHGLAAVAVTSGEKDISENLVQTLRTFTQGIEDLQITIALDCDTKGQRVALQMQETLSNAGFPSVRAVDLGLGDGGDLADFCMLHGSGPDCWHALRDTADLRPVFQVQQIQRWQILHASKLAELPPVEWLIPGEIPDRGLTIVYGPSGVGKSFRTLDYALRIAQSAPVVYMAGEGVSGYSSRVEAWSKHHHAGLGQLFMCLGAVSFMDDEDLGNFVREVERQCKAPALVVIDTLARSMLGADENSTRDMGKFVESCEQVAHYFDCAVMIVHHTNKGGNTERGSGALRGAAGSMIKLIDEDDLIRVECSKSKDSKAFEPYYMKLLPVDIGATDRDGNAVMPPVIVPSEKVIQSEQDELTSKQRLVLETLALDAFEYGATPSEISAYLPDVTDRALYRVLSSLKRFGFVSQDAKREPYVITVSGLEKISLHSRSHTAHPVTHDGSDTVTDKRTQSSSVNSDVMTDMNVSSDSTPPQKRLLDAPTKGAIPHYQEGY